MATVCGVAASLFSAQLQSSTLAVITYDENTLDADLGGAVWRMFTEQLAGMWIGKVHTLILLVDTVRVDYERHCSRGSSLAYRLASGGVERRKDWHTSVADIHLLRPRDDGLVVLFLGAGFSASSGLPLGDELRDDALRHMFPAAPTGVPQLIDVFRSYLGSQDRWLPLERSQPRDEFARTLTLERVLREELHRVTAAASPTLQGFATRDAAAVARPGRAVQALGRLMTRQRNLVIVTVNFDRLVEKIGNAQVYADDTDFVRCCDDLRQYKLRGGSIPVLKLHGTIDRPDTIVATVDATARGLSREKTEALNELARLGAPLPWAFVGYSMRDPDLEGLLGQPAFYSSLDESWVSPFTVETARLFTVRHRVYAADQRDFWHRSITETADVFFDELAAAWSV